MKIRIIVEKGESNYGAYSPDVPRCIAVGDTVEETLKRMQEALEVHFEGLQEDGLPLVETDPNIYPEARYIDVRVPA